MKFQFREGWSSIILLLGMLLAVAWSLEAAQWAEGMTLIQWALIAALILGAVTAKSHLPGWFVHPCAAIISVAWSFFLASDTLNEKLTWNAKVLQMYERYYAWLTKALAGNTNSDNLIFLLECLLVFFWIAHLAAWFVYRRHQNWPAILAPGVLLIINIYYAQGSHEWFLFMYLLCALLFVVRTHLTAQEMQWQHAGVGYNRMVGLEFLRDGALFSVVVILMAQALPAAAASPQLLEVMQSLEGPWMSVREKWGQLFASLNYKPEPNGTGFFGVSLTLGGPLRLNSTPMMTVQMANGRYWAAVAYDKYNGKGWEDTDAVSLVMRSPDARLASLPFSARELITQTYKVFYPTSQLFGAPQAVAWSRPIVAQMNRDPNAQAATQAENAPPIISMAYSAIPTRANDQYTVLSLAPRADNKMLRKAGADYPAWVKDRYLQVPPRTPTRIKTLAERVVAEAKATNNFDKAIAIEAFLRTFTYDEFIQAPPTERDVVDYFLFTSKRGYCNYYASAMAIMLRMLDIPARTVSGYARGEYDNDAGIYTVRESDSHTWVEVFFPDYGWIQFEPTAAQPELERFEGADSPDTSSDSDPEAGNARGPNIRDRDRMIEELENFEEGDPGALFPIGNIDVPLTGVSYVGIFALMVALIAALAAFISWRRHLAGLTMMEAQYETLQRYGRLLGNAPRIGHTPHEFAASLAARVPTAAAILTRFVDLYVRSLFAREPLSKDEERAAQALWPPLRKNFLQQFVNQLGQRFLRPIEDRVGQKKM
jgi:transglutaminase-like putative cysteine protease